MHSLSQLTKLGSLTVVTAAALALGAAACDRNDNAASTTFTTSGAWDAAVNNAFNDPTIPNQIPNQSGSINDMSSTNGAVTPQEVPMVPPQMVPAPNAPLPNAQLQMQQHSYAYPNANLNTPNANMGVNGTGVPMNGAVNGGMNVGSMNGTRPMNDLGSVNVPGAQSNGATGAPQQPPPNVNGTVPPGSVP